MHMNNKPSFDLTDLEMANIDLQSMEVMPVTVAMALPEAGASCCSDACSTCCSSS
jgi:hypothetical protein